MDQLNTQNAEIVPGYNMRAALPIGKGKMKSTAKVSAGPVIKKSKNSLLALKLCDYLLSPSGTELMTMGIEGTTYNLDEKGMAKYVGFEDKVPSTTELQEKYGLYSTGLFLRTDRRSAYFNLTETQAEAIDKLSKKGFWQEDPKLRLTKEESDTINSILVDLGKGSEEFAVKYILNNGTDKDWEDWLKKAEKIGVNKLLDALNKAQARYDAEL
jgi:putative aldouronate transport system substrate-binding protein